MSELGGLASGCRGDGINQMPNLLYGGCELLLQRLVSRRRAENCVISHGRKTTDPIKSSLSDKIEPSGYAGTHFHGDIISAGQGLSNRGEGSLLNVSDALIDVIDGVITLSLSRCFVPIIRNMSKKKKSYSTRRFTPLWRAIVVCLENTICIFDEMQYKGSNSGKQMSLFTI